MLAAPVIGPVKHGDCAPGAIYSHSRHVVFLRPIRPIFPLSSLALVTLSHDMVREADPNHLVASWILSAKLRGRHVSTATVSEHMLSKTLNVLLYQQSSHTE